MHARVAGEEQTFTGRVVLGCDGANSTIRELAGITMEDLGFTERWLVVDMRAAGGLDTWDGVEQVCDPARAATFMHVTGDRYRWEFRLLDGNGLPPVPQALTALRSNPALTVIVRPDRVVAAVTPGTVRRAADGGKEMAPALLALAITTAYLAVALTS